MSTDMKGLLSVLTMFAPHDIPMNSWRVFFIKWGGPQEWMVLMDVYSGKSCKKWMIRLIRGYPLLYDLGKLHEISLKSPESFVAGRWGWPKHWPPCTQCAANVAASGSGAPDLSSPFYWENDATVWILLLAGLPFGQFQTGYLVPLRFKSRTILMSWMEKDMGNIGKYREI